MSLRSVPTLFYAKQEWKDLNPQHTVLETATLPFASHSYMALSQGFAPWHQSLDVYLSRVLLYYSAMTA